MIGVFFFACVSSAPDLEIEKIDKGSVIIAELDNPAVYDFVIRNRGVSDNFEIYSLVGVSMSPKGTFILPNGRKRIVVFAYPSEMIRENNEGLFNFEYQLRGQNTGIFKDQMMINIVPLKDALSIEVESIVPGDEIVEITIKNKHNTNLGDIKMRFDSLFFSSEKEISLVPFEEINISVDMDKSIADLAAGPYVVTASVGLEDAVAEIEGTVQYLEKEGTSIFEDKEGVIVRKTTITKKNEGNVLTSGEIGLKKDIVSRLFTIFSEDPSQVSRQGLFVDYSWEKDLMPNESFSITSTTNYTFPFLLILMVIVIVFLVKIYSFGSVSVNKRVLFVRTKGGEFALKVRLRVKARKNVGKVRLIDSLPMNIKIYEGFGKKPDGVDEEKRLVFWDVGGLQGGEERVFSYIIYSKIRVVGRFELPSARIVFDEDGEKKEVWSNRTFFESEMVGE